jgi:hypothetical protein
MGSDKKTESWSSVRKGLKSSPRKKKTARVVDASGDFQLEDAVEVRSEERGGWEPAIIHRLHKDGTVSIELDRGPKLRKIDRSRIRKQGSKKKALSNPFEAGEAVEAKFEGVEWRPGQVTKYHKREDTYDIEYDNGKTEVRVPPADVREYSKKGSDTGESDEELETDDEVDVRDEEDRRYYPAVVTRVHKDKTVDVLYDADETLEKRVERKRIPPKRIGKKGAAMGKAMVKRQPGDRVEVTPDNENEYYPATVERVHKDESCDIRFDQAEFGMERFVPKKNIRDLVGGDYFSPFRVGHTVELLRNPETQEFSTAFVRKVRPDGTVDVEFAAGGEEKQVKPWRLRLVHPGGFDMLPSGTEVEVLCPHSTGGASYSRGKVRWLHRDGRYVVQTEDKLTKRTRIHQAVTIDRIRVPGMEAGVPPSPPSTLASFAANLGLEALALVWFIFGAIVEMSEGWGILFNTESDGRLQDQHWVASQYNSTHGSIGLPTAASMASARHCLVDHGLLPTTFTYLGIALRIDPADIDPIAAGLGIGLASSTDAPTPAASGIATLSAAQVLDAVKAVQDFDIGLNVPLVPTHAFAAARAWVQLTLVLGGVLLAMVAIAGGLLLWRKYKMLEDSRIDHHALRSNWKLRACLAALQLAYLTAACLSVVAYSMILSKLHFYCLWSDGESMVTDASLALPPSYSNPSLPPPGHGVAELNLASLWHQHDPFEARTHYPTLADAVQGVMGKTCFNIFRGLFFLLVLEGGGMDLFRRLLWVLPSTLAVSCIMAKIIAAMELLYYVHRKATGPENHGAYGMTYEQDMAVANFFFSFWFGALLVRSLLEIKRYDMVLLEQNGRRSRAEEGVFAWEEAERQGRSGGKIDFYNPTKSLDDGDDLEAGVRGASEVRVRMNRYDDRTLSDLEAAKVGSYGQLAQKEARATEADNEVRDSNLLTYSAFFCFRGGLFHFGAAWFMAAANIVVRQYLGSSSAWDKWVNLDLAFTCFWAVLMTALPVAVAAIKATRQPHPRRGLSARY